MTEEVRCWLALNTRLALLGWAVWLGGVGSLAANQDMSADWWSLKPLQRPALPHLSDPGEKWVRNPVDAFVWAKLEAQRLIPSPEVDRRVLIRRVYFDLTGLPPSPAAVDAFLADRDPLAYEKVIDLLLDSPRYGERWARHWLDVVHYGDTHGYDKDKLRLNAWPYRDYVIRAFNSDKPYGRFVEEQLAGDQLFPGTADGIEALGFIAAGPWDFIGHAEVAESKIDGQIARMLDRDDMVSNTLNTFSSLTVHCARCHDHKFDPISQEDYYGLQAVFAALDRADRPYDTDPALAQTRRGLQDQEQLLRATKESLDKQIAALGGDALVEIDKKIETLEKKEQSTPRPEFGYHSAIESRPDVVKWVQVDLGQPTTINKLVWTGCRDDFNGIGDGFGFPLRFRIELSNDAEFQTGVQLLAEQTASDFPNPGVVPQSALVNSLAGRYVRLTATRLALRQNDYIFALAELEVYDDQGSNVASQAAVTALDSIEAPPRWARENLVDGIHPGAVAATEAGSFASLRRERAALLEARVEPELREQATENQRELEATGKQLKALPDPKMVYAGTVYNGSGAFRGTGPDGGQPRVIRVLFRGDVTTPGEEVSPGAIEAVPGLSARFKLASKHSEGERRAALARWLTASENPLTWRSIVNRVWLYHFGRGLVDTPNDFGRMGQLPTHPELLDWLAVEFRDGGQSLKWLHRLLVTSATYRQSSSSASGETADRTQTIDADNTLLWRMNRRRLEAEAIRDSVLWISGKLDQRMYGPGFQDFVIDKPDHSPHYEYHLHDPDDPKTHRRSVYRFLVRSQQQPFMRTLDCADPSMLVDKRNESLSALQALALLNNGFMLTMSRHFADKLDRGEGTLANKVERGFTEALGRSPTVVEKDQLVEYATTFGLTNACRVLFNLNEFTFVD